jgi:hypothetical protein
MQLGINLKLKINLEFKLADMWIGIFWRTQENPLDKRHITEIWICIIPCLPIHIQLTQS